jgi:sortase A
MSLSRVIAGVGRLLVGMGLLVLLFVGYQLWGTGLHEARAQDRLADQFDELLAGQVGKSTSSLAPKPSESVPPVTVPGGPAATTTLAPPPDPSAVERVVVKEGDALARIRIPKIGVDKVVVEGVAVPDLRKGPGHYQNTPQPGQKGNVAIAGHRTTYGAPFGVIDQLVPGDPIVVTTTQGTFTYVVMPAPDDPSEGHFVVKPTDVWVLDDTGDNRLTLTACHPKYSARQRLIVTAQLVGPVVATPTTTTPVGAASGGGTGTTVPAPDAAAATRVDAPSLDEGLGGDPGARTPALLWGVVFLLALAGVWQLSIGWRKWPTYAASVVPMAFVLFLRLEQLDRWLPAR